MTLRQLIEWHEYRLSDAEFELSTVPSWDKHQWELAVVAYRETIEQLARLEGLEK